MSDKSVFATKKPRWPVFVLQRARDRGDGRDLIVEPWEGSPPFGWTAGLRIEGTDETDYLGSAGHYAPDLIHQYARPGQTTVEVEGYFDGSTPEFIGVFDLTKDGALPYTDGWDPYDPETDEEW